MHLIAPDHQNLICINEWQIKLFYYSRTAAAVNSIQAWFWSDNPNIVLIASLSLLVLLSVSLSNSPCTWQSKQQQYKMPIRSGQNPFVEFFGHSHLHTKGYKSWALFYSILLILKGFYNRKQNQTVDERYILYPQSMHKNKVEPWFALLITHHRKI